MSDTGGYTTKRAKARKPYDFYIDDYPLATTYGDRNGVRGVRLWTARKLTARDIKHLQRWLARAAAWCEQGGRR